LERTARFLTKKERCRDILRSAAAFSCLILDHLLCPLCNGGAKEKARQH
jgi:hypothetical protein